MAVNTPKEGNRMVMGTAPLPATATAMVLSVEFDREEDGRWIAEIPELPGVLAYADSQQHALVRVTSLALRVLADKMEGGDAVPTSVVFAIREQVA